MTNGIHPFERECVDIFHFEEQDIGDPTSISIMLEPKGFVFSSFSSHPFKVHRSFVKVFCHIYFMEPHVNGIDHCDDFYNRLTSLILD